MKKITMYLSLLLAAGILFSCGSTKTEEIVSESSDKVSRIKVSAKRTMSVDPFQTSIVIEGFNQSDTIMTEIYARDLNNENVKFAWADNGSCTLTIIQQDDSKRTLDVQFSEEGNSLRERQVQ